MTLALNIGGASKDVTGIAVRIASGLKTVTEGWVRTADGLKQFYAQLSVTVSPTAPIGRANSATIVNVTSEPVTATAAGAVGDVTHSWTRTDSDPHVWTIDDPISATTTFSTICDQQEHFTATFIDTITDQAGQSIASAPVTVDCANIFFGGGFRGTGSIPGQVYP